MVLGSHHTARCCGRVFTACTNVKHVSYNDVKPLQNNNKNNNNNKILNSSLHIDIGKKPASFILTNVHLLVAEGFILFVPFVKALLPNTVPEQSDSAVISSRSLFKFHFWQEGRNCTSTWPLLI